MAANLLDTIINDTIQPLGGHELLHHHSLVTPLHLNESSMSPVSNLDSLSSLMQENEMSKHERIFWILLFSSMVLIAAGGNMIVIYIVSTNKEMKSVTNYFLVNLSLADTMVSTLNVIFNFISMLNSHWPFGGIYCKISNFIAILSITASVFTLTAISCDRYNAIIHPLRPRMSHRNALSWIGLIWTLSSALALPNIIYSVVVEDRLVNENLALTCTMIWPDGRYPLSSYDHIYNIVILVITYLIPITTMAILYFKVGKELWGSEAIGEDVEKQRRALMAKKKIVKMMIVVVIIFALCWLPYHAFFVVNYYLPTIFQDGPLYYQRCYLIMYWLAMSNSMYNPIIIYFMNSKFRLEFKRVLYFAFCCRKYTVPISIKANNELHQQQQQQQQQHQHDQTTNHTTATQRQQLSPSSNEITGPRAAMRAATTLRSKTNSTTMTAANLPSSSSSSSPPLVVVGPPNHKTIDSAEPDTATMANCHGQMINPIEVVVTAYYPQAHDHQLAACQDLTIQAAVGQLQTARQSEPLFVAEQEPFLGVNENSTTGGNQIVDTSIQCSQTPSNGTTKPRNKVWI